MIKRTIGLFLIVASAFLATGCGRVTSAKSLISRAKSEHGQCTVISKEEDKEHTLVVLKDELQGFEYKVGSGKHDLMVDGSYFCSTTNDYDYFAVALANYTMGQVLTELDSYCRKHNLTYESIAGGEVFIRLVYPGSMSDQDAIAAAEEVAALFQKYNVNNRLDGYQVTLSHDYEWFKSVYGVYNPGHNAYPDEVYSSYGMGNACYVGSVKLPGCKFEKRTDE